MESRDSGARLDAPEALAPSSLAPRRPSASVLGKVAAILGLTAMLLAIHYATPVRPDTMPLHNIHRHLLYFPIILAAFWFGVRGGLASAAVIFLFYFPHVYAGPHAEHVMVTNWTNVNHLLEGATYLMIGGLTGWLIDRLRTEKFHLRIALDRVRQSARELFQSEEQLRRADRLTALGQLSAGLAHEIRNPLGSIRGAVEILGDPETGPDQRREFGRVLVEETERLDTVLRNFLDYARTQRNGSAGPTALDTVLDRLLTLMDSKLKASGIAVGLDLDRELPPLAIGEALLQQVLLNVVLNAVQAMPDGGELRIEAVPDAARRAVVVAVSDTGPGIPPEIRQRVFDPFFTTKGTGSGLGLSIVHKIVTSHHGAVTIGEQSSPGARIELTLPAA